MSNQCLQYGEMLRGLFTVAQTASPKEWRGDHPAFCLLAAKWVQEFRSLESSFERLPDGWAEMAEKESELEIATRNPFIDPGYSMLTKSGAEEARHSEEILTLLEEQAYLEEVLTAAKWWLPLWQKLFPAIRGHRTKAPPDGPVGDRGWRHKGVEISGLNGGDAMEAMRLLHDKPNGHSIRPDCDPKKLADLVNANCKKIGLPWRVERSTKAGTLTKIPAGTKKGA